MPAYPWTLLALWILPAVAGLLVYAHVRRRAAARRFVDAVMADRLMPPPGSARPWLKGAKIVAGIGLLIFAAAQPQCGFEDQKVVQRGADIVILLDVSRSMTAQDVGQSRLDRAKSDIRDLLAFLDRDRVGLVVFAGKAVVKSPLTSDHGFFLSILDEIDATSAPRGGTLIGDGIRKCLEMLHPPTDRDRVIVLITDGDDHESFPLEAAKDARDQGVKILAVGLGDAKEGARIPIDDPSGQPQYLKHDGEVVWSKLQGKLLEDIALTTNGAYIPAGTFVYDLGQFYEQHLLNISRTKYQEERRGRPKEQFQWYVFFGLALLIAELALPAYRRPVSFALSEKTSGVCETLESRRLPKSEPRNHDSKHRQLDAPTPKGRIP